MSVLSNLPLGPNRSSNRLRVSEHGLRFFKCLSESDEQRPRLALRQFNVDASHALVMGVRGLDPTKTCSEASS